MPDSNNYGAIIGGGLGGLLGPYGAAAGGGLGGAAGADELHGWAGLGGAGGGMVGSLGGSIAGGLGGAGLGALVAAIQGEDPSEYGAAGGIGGALLGSAIGSGLGANWGASEGVDERKAELMRRQLLQNYTQKNSSVQETPMSHEKVAYARGALTKLAEHNVDAPTFIAHAMLSENRGSLKVASLIMQGWGIEKLGSRAGAGSAQELFDSMRAMLQRGELDVGGRPSLNALKDSLEESMGGAEAAAARRANVPRPPNPMESVEIDPEIAQQLDITAGNRMAGGGFTRPNAPSPYAAGPSPVESGPYMNAAGGGAMIPANPRAIDGGAPQDSAGLSPALLAALGLGGAGAVGGVGYGMSSPDTTGNKLRDLLGMDTKNRFQMAMG